MLSKHASIRGQQRGIPRMAIDLILMFGVSEPNGSCHDVEKVFLDKAARKKLRAYAGPLAPLLEEYLDVYAVVDVSRDTVITVCHREANRIRRN